MPGLIVEWEGGIISLIFGSELVKIEGARLSLSQVSRATHSTAADTAGFCRRDDREERSRRGEDKER